MFYFFVFRTFQGRTLTAATETFSVFVWRNREHSLHPNSPDTNYRSVPWKFELVNIEYWGKSIPAKLFAQFPNHVIRALDHEFYETMMDDSAKIEAIYAYDDRQKDAMKERIIHYNTG